jgi:hypothetical protein
MKKENLKLQKKIEVMQDEVKDLTETLESGMEAAKRGQGFKFGMGLDKQGNKQRRAEDMNRQEREKLKRNLFVGVDFIGDEEIRVN